MTDQLVKPNLSGSLLTKVNTFFKSTILVKSLGALHFSQLWSLCSHPDITMTVDVDSFKVDPSTIPTLHWGEGVSVKSIMTNPTSK